MEHIPPANHVINTLTNSHYMVHVGTYQGLYIEASQSPTELSFWHNLGLTPPTKAQAISMLDTLESFAGKLLSDPTFKDFLANRNLSYELYVASGQMDFHVARRSNGQTEWMVELA